MEREFKVKSLAKAIRLLECFSDSRPELGVTELAQMLDLQKSTVHNIASTFESLGYLSKNKESGKYYLGLKLLQFSYIINNHMGFRKFFLPYMQKIAREVNETVFLGIPHGAEVLYIECVFPMENLGGRNILGEHAPMYCTGLGKAMMAYLPLEKQEEYAAYPLTKFTENTIITKEALLADMEEIRGRGYSIDNMEHEYGVTCIGIPVFGHDHNIVAAISVSAPSLRFDEEMIKKNADIMQQILESAQYKL